MHKKSKGRRTMSESKETELGSKPIGKLLFQLAVPAIVAQIINLLYNLVDRMYIGHIEGEGALALTGIGVTLPVLLLISAFAALVGFGGAPRASICMGRKDHEQAEKILGNCVAAIVLLSIVLTIFFRIFGEKILLIFGASAETIPYAIDYLNIYTWGTIFVQIALGLNMFISSQGFTQVSMKTVLIGALLNIILDPIFIFGFDMGVRGAALATIISQGVSAVWVLKFLCGQKTILKIRKKNLRLQTGIILPVLGLGISPFIMQSTESVLQVCFNTSLLKYGGNVAVGSMTIMSSIMQFSMMPLQGLTQGMQPIVSYNYGAKNVERVKKAFKVTLISSLLFSTLIWAFAMFFPQVLAMAFTSDKELIEFTSWGIRTYMSVSLIFGAQIACQQTFLALGNAKISLFLALLRKIILLVPFIYILPAFFENKTFGVILAEPVADFIAVITTVTMFYFSFKKTIAKLENDKEE